MLISEHSTVDNLQIIYEDNHLILVNKRSGDIVQGDKTGDIPLSEVVKKFIAKKYNKPGAVFLGVVHRLDRPTSGLIVFARTSKALTRLNKMFATRQTKKTYLAMVKSAPNPENGVLEHFLLRNTKQNKSYAHLTPVPGAKKAELHYETLSRLDNYSLLRIDLNTGRHHQIRAQLAAIGAPVKGDLKYGASRSNPNGSIHLHAYNLEFVHPIKKQLMSFTAPLPDDPLWQSLSL